MLMIFKLCHQMQEYTRKEINLKMLKLEFAVSFYRCAAKMMRSSFVVVFTAVMEPGDPCWRVKFVPAQTPDTERLHAEPSLKPRRWWKEQQGMQKSRPISMVQHIKLPFTEKRHSGPLLVTPVLQEGLAGWEMAPLSPNHLSTNLIFNFSFQSVLKSPISGTQIC